MQSSLVSTLAILLLGFVSTACAADDAVCPVSGKKAKKVSTEYHGGAVYFCCKNCSLIFIIKFFQLFFNKGPDVFLHENVL